MNKETKVTVTLQIFSGRPNPRWELSPEKADVLLEKLGEVRKRNLQEEPPDLSRLGYRGFQLLIESPEKEFTGTFTLFGGRLVSGVKKERSAMKDTSEIERLLLEDAREQGFGELLDQVINPDSM